MASAAAEDVQAKLFAAAAACTRDPLRYVKLAYPWGEKAGPLERFEGPDTWQVEVLSCIRDNLSRKKPLLIAVAGGNGPGKALAHGEPVLTPAGWRPVESLQVGDDVIAGDGSATAIVGVWPQGERDLFRVTLADGSSVVVDGDHQWLTWSLLERKRNRAPSIRTTSEIGRTVIGRQTNGQLNHRVPTCGAVDHPRAALPVEPYLLGLWLGDGSGKGRIGVSLPDKIAAVAASVAGLRHATKGRPDYFTWQAIPQPTLRLLALGGCRAAEKFVPRVYLHASIAQRTALLQGLLDTDGTVEAKSAAITFDTMSARLADDVSELVRSLGGVARRGTKRATLNGEDYGTAYRVYVSLPPEISPFRTAAKAARYKPEWGHRNCERTRRRYIESVEPVGRGLATCISVAHPSKLFVTRDHIVTHNSALASWVVDWAMSTAPDTRINVTANTGVQLSTKTWPEISKWHRMSLFGSWFDLQHRRLRSADPDHHDTWRCDAITWEEATAEAFQGLHNVGKRMVFVFDESSAIPPAIWEAQEGSLTDVDTEIIWLCLGNPTRATGRFRECFPGGKHARLWKPFKIDTRQARMANQEQINEWIKTYGLDHDFVRVRVLSEFPNASSTQFIATDLVEAAASAEREASGTFYDPLVIGVDVAAEGDDKSVIRFRRGRDARSIAPIKFRGMMPMQLAARIAELNERYKPDAIFIDQTGVGLGVVDRCRQLQLPVFGIDFGSNPDRNDREASAAYYNKRAEIYGLMREWLRHGMIDDDPELKSDLTAVEYGYKLKDGRDCILLERKKDMKARGLASPDDSDALALTFSYTVAPTDHLDRIAGAQSTFKSEYDPLANV